MRGRSRCTDRTIWVGGAKREYGDVRIWCTHPVTGKLIQIRHWRDLQRLEEAARRSGIVWDHRVAYLTGLRALTSEGAAAAEAALDGEDNGVEVVYADGRTARGKPTPMVDGATLSSYLLGGSSDLGKLGVAQVTWSLLGNRTSVQAISRVAEALRHGDRGNLVLAGAAAPALTSDEVLKVLDLERVPNLRSRHLERVRDDLPIMLASVPAPERYKFLLELCEAVLDETKEYSIGDLADAVAVLTWAVRVGAKVTRREGDWVRTMQEAVDSVKLSKREVPPTGFEHLEGVDLEVDAPLTITQETRRGLAVLREEVPSSITHASLSLRCPRTIGELTRWGALVGGVVLDEKGAVLGVFEKETLRYLAALDVEDGAWRVNDVQARDRKLVPTQVADKLVEMVKEVPVTLWWGMEDMTVLLEEGTRQD